MDSKIKREVITTNDAPVPRGPFSQAIKVDRTMYMSGQVGRDPKSGNLVEGGIEPETTQVLKNMQAVLKAAGADLHNVVKTTVLLDDLNDFSKMNAIYESYFNGRAKPARACYQVARLPLGCKVEIEAVAVLGEIEDVEPKS